MTVFLTPGGEPFYGGTYYPKPTFLQLMAAIRRRGGPADELVTNVTARCARRSPFARARPARLPGVDRSMPASSARRTFDPEWGGFGGAPSSPRRCASTWSCSDGSAPGRCRDSDSCRPSSTSLDAMASGGIYDHIGGGFARYSVDALARPHFEKMLYDQALLVACTPTRRRARTPSAGAVVD